MLRDIAPKPAPGGVKRARKLRRTMSLPEVLLWQALRERPAGLKFRKQHPSGAYILDFYCADARLAIEIDGEAHSRGDRPGRDGARDVWLDGHGIATLRIPAVELLRDLDAAMRWILHIARSRLPLHHPAAPGGPPPRDKLGED
jgi:very-short-patch-repair endonuclease